MHIFPRIPKSILFLDSLRGKRSQVYLDSDNYHQYYKELDFIRKVQQWEKETRKDYIRARGGNYNPIKLNDYLNTGMLKTFGYSTLFEDIKFIYG